MKTRHLGRALVALVAATAMLGLFAPPASANDAEILGGTLALFASDSTLLHTQDLGDDTASHECEPSSSSLTVTGTNHAWTFTSTSRVSVSIVTIHFIATTTISLTGLSSNGGTSTGGGVASVSLQRSNSSTTSCTPIATTQCVIAITAIALQSVTHNVTSTGAVSSSAALASGDNGDHGDFGFEVSVTGTQTDCGALIAADDGSVTLTNIDIHAIN